jgi:predicted HAD superfamily phosphohydrolase YqeG
MKRGHLVRSLYNNQLAYLEKKTIVFDIDETLVITSNEPFDPEITTKMLTTSIKVK